VRRLLVTGGAGFIGANFVRHWRSNYPADRVVVLDALTYAGNRVSLPAEEAAAFRFVHGDIRDRSLVARLLREEGICTLVHFAAESHVDRSIRGPAAFVDTNVGGTLSLLEAAREVWLDAAGGPRKHRFHHVSTDEVFGSLGAEDPPFCETTPYAPNSPYAASKAASDHLVRAWHRTYGLDITISNCSNNYGPYHFPEKLIPLTIVNLLEGRPLPIYGDGRQVRDWLFVEDHCRAVEAVLLRGRSGETYAVGGGGERSNIEIVRTLCRLIDQAFAVNPDLARRYPKSPAMRGGSAASITYVRDRPGHDRRYAVDTGKISTDLSFSPSITLEDGLRQTLAWYLANESWWRGVMDGSYRDWIGLNYAVA